MDIAKLLLFIGASAQIIGTIHYIIGMFRGEVKPNRVTWILWAIAPGIGVASALVDGAGLEVLPVFMAGFGPLLVFIASFFIKNAYWRLQKFDHLCGVSSLLALVLWGITKDPLIAYIFSIIADFFAGVPTFIKIWKHPETESVSTYLAGLFSASISMFVMKSWVFTSYGFSMYVIVANLFIVYLGLQKPKTFKTK